MKPNTKSFHFCLVEYWNTSTDSSFLPLKREACKKTSEHLYFKLFLLLTIDEKSDVFAPSRFAFFVSATGLLYFALKTCIMQRSNSSIVLLPTVQRKLLSNNFGPSTFVRKTYHFSEHCRIRWHFKSRSIHSRI